MRRNRLTTGLAALLFLLAMISYASAHHEHNDPYRGSGGGGEFNPYDYEGYREYGQGFVAGEGVGDEWIRFGYNDIGYTGPLYYADDDSSLFGEDTFEFDSNGFFGSNNQYRDHTKYQRDKSYGYDKDLNERKSYSDGWGK